MEDALGAATVMLSIFGGISLVVWASTKARIARMMADRASQFTGTLPQDGAVLAELKAMKQQMAEMHSTSHQFDLSFDDALNRLEGRVSRIETKAATRTAVTAEDTPAVQQNGTGH